MKEENNNKKSNTKEIKEKNKNNKKPNTKVTNKKNKSNNKKPNAKVAKKQNKTLKIKNNKLDRTNKKSILNKLLIIVITLILLIIVAYLVLLLIPPKIIDLKVSEINENNQVTLTVKIKKLINKKVYCNITENEINNNNWILSKNNECSFDLDAGNYKIYLKNEDKILKTVYEKEIEINKILDLKVDKDIIYLPVGGSQTISTEILSLGNVDKTLNYEIDNNIATIDDNVIKGIGVGETELIIKTTNNIEKKIKIEVTNLIKKQYIDNNRKKLSCGVFTKEEAHKIDEILFDRLNKVGYKTRASAVEAARFLTLSLPYKVPYFFELGRLNNHPGRPKVDGEGRYYHKGLYLSTDKYEDLVAIKYGPATWGCPLINYQTEAGFVAGRKYPNGLSCSGFISWVLYNGGFDVGDSGAGDFPYRNDDLSDLGEKQELTYELMKSGKVKVGDLIGRDGHIAMIAGMDEKNVYVAESLASGVVIETFERYKGIVDCNLYGYILLMDSVYKEDGKLTNMWVF